MQQCLRKIGILGGTFNPVHCGHLIIAESVRESFSLDKILFIPSGQPPHKPDSEVIDAECRMEMVRLAIHSNPCFEASRAEVDRKGYSYTVDTLRLLRKEYGEETGLYFIIGADIIPELEAWREFQNIFRICEFIAVLRPGHGWKTFDKEIEHLKREYGLKINMTKAPLVDISSSDIREKLRTGKSIKYLVPENVEKYIETEGLYR